ncbi:MAG: hypothetical protein R3F37_04355 [Candidatus Competibacteraceae bacterium]
MEERLESPSLCDARHHSTAGYLYGWGLKQLAVAEVNVFRVMPNNDRVKMTYNLDEIQEGTIEDPEVQGGDYLIVETSEARKFLRDSLFRDITDFFNPFRFVQ